MLALMEEKARQLLEEKTRHEQAKLEEKVQRESMLRRSREEEMAL